MHRFAKTLAVVAQRSALPLFKAPQAQRVALNMSPMKIAVRSFSAEVRTVPSYTLAPKLSKERTIDVEYQYLSRRNLLLIITIENVFSIL